MTRTTLLSCFAASTALLLISGCKSETANAQEKLDTKIDLIVYREDFGMVSDDRDLEIEAGRNRLHIPRLSQHLDPDSIRFDWTSKGEEPRLVSSTFNLGTGSSNELLKRLIGQEVEFIWRSDNGHPGDRMKGVLEMVDDSGIVIRADGKLYVNPDGTLIIPGEGGRSNSAGLSVEVDSKNDQSSTLEMSYLTRGLSWSANYVASLDHNEDEMSLECWATVKNETGIDFEDAGITLVAGSPNRAVSGFAADSRAKSGFQSEDKFERSAHVAAQASVPLELGELHSYKVDSKASIAHNQMNRVLMFEAARVPVKRDYSVAMPWLSYGYGWGNQPQRIGAQLAISFKNEKAAALGMPLPSGAVRFYEGDGEGKSQFVGASGIGDLPKDSPVFLTLSKVFDVYVDGVKTSRVRVDKRTSRVTTSMVLHNEKPVPVVLRVVQPIGSNWKIVNEDTKHIKTGQNAEWKVSVPAGGETNLKYTVEVRE